MGDVPGTWTTVHTRNTTRRNTTTPPMMSFVEGTVIREMGFTVGSSIEKACELPVLNVELEKNLFIRDFYTTILNAKQADPHIPKKHEILLNNTKTQLDDLEIQKWKKHTQKTLRNSMVKKRAQVIAPLMCTKAFLKCWEMLYVYGNVFNLYSNDQGNFITYHLCEAPGNLVFYIYLNLVICVSDSSTYQVPLLYPRIISYSNSFPG